MHKTDVLGVKVDPLRKNDVLELLRRRLAAKEKTFIITPYSEFFYLTFRDYRLQSILNSADLSLADGIGTVWAAHYLNRPLKAKTYYAKVFEATAQAFLTLAEIIMAPKNIYSPIPEKITGSDFIWDLAALAEKENLSVFLLGGKKEIPGLAAQLLQKKFPRLKIAGYSNQLSDEQGIVQRINSVHADILMVAFGPGKQEKWIYENLKKLDVKIAIGLGGAFDYLTGAKQSPPKWVRALGLEWLFRLITQPSRFLRIWHATVPFVLACVREKVFLSQPYRENVVGVVLNKQGEILAVKRAIDRNTVSPEEHWQFPQGGSDGQNLEKAVLREMHEELGLSNLIILGRATETHHYDWRHALRPLLFNKLKYRGQRQNIFFLQFNGTDSEISLQKIELSEYKWLKKNELEEKMHSFRQPLVLIVKNELPKFIKPTHPGSGA